MDVAMENYDSIQKTHRAFVEHLEEVFDNISKRIDTIDNKITYLQRKNKRDERQSILSTERGSIMPSNKQKDIHVQMMDSNSSLGGSVNI